VREKYKKTTAKTIIALFLTLMLAVLVFGYAKTPTASAATGINHQINFQGKLVNANGTNVTNGTYNLEFKLWDAGSAGANLWTEDRIGNAGAPDNRVTVTNGVFQVNLGSITALPGSVNFNTDNIYLSINLGGTNLACTAAPTFTADTNCAADGEMSPRVQFTAAPYAFNTDRLDGIDATGFVQLGQSASAQTDSSTTNPSIFINKTNASGTPNILQLQKGGTDILTITNTGSSTFRPTTDSTTAFRIQNSSSDDILSVDSTGSNLNNLITNDNVESAISGNWTLKGSAAISQDATQHYDGANSLKIITTAVANDGAKQAVTLTDSTTYSASFYAKLNSTSNAMATLAAGYSSDGSTDNTACSLNTTTLLPSQWVRVSCNFTTPASHSGTPYFYIKQTDGVIHTFSVDAVLLQTSANTDNNYRDGKITLQGTVVSPLIVQNAADSANSLTVQNSAGTNIFNVDTLDTNIITNGGFEVGTAGWQAVGGSTTISRDPSQSWLGNASLNVTTSATASAGAKFTTGNVQPTQLAISSTYTISWYGKLNSATFTDMMAAYDRDGSGAGAPTNCTGITAQTIVTTGWTRISCTITTDGTTPAADAYVLIMQTAGTARTFYLDGVQLDAGGTATPYGAGNFFFNGSITSPMTFKNQADSTDAFKIQDSTSVALFQVDTLNDRVYVGNPTADAVGVVLVLDNKTTAADPTGVNGAIYYNTATAQFRCYRDGAWENCGINPIDRGFSIEDDFLGGGTAAGTIGSAGWVPNTIGTACTVTYGQATPAPTADRPGVLRCATAATITTGTAFTLGTSTGGSQVIAPGMVIKAAGAVGSSTTTTNALRIGSYAVLTSAQTTTSGVWWEADPTANANWRYCYATGAAATCAASATAIAANTFARLEIRVISSTAIDFIINGVKTSLTGISPNFATRVNPTFTCYTQVASAQNCFMDYYQIRSVASAAR
jgi:hypothetical protein